MVVTLICIHRSTTCQIWLGWIPASSWPTWTCASLSSRTTFDIWIDASNVHYHCQRLIVFHETFQRTLIEDILFWTFMRPVLYRTWQTVQMVGKIHISHSVHSSRLIVFHETFQRTLKDILFQLNNWKSDPDSQKGTKKKIRWGNSRKCQFSFISKLNIICF